LAGVNPLHKVRDGAASAWRKSRDGTTRTAGWVKSGVSGAAGKARTGVAGIGGGSETGEKKSPGAVRDGISGGWERVGGASLLHRARSDNRVGAAVIIGAILFVLWIAWTIYVWTENGSTAGLGVLITWPAVLAAIALVASPFVAAVILVKRLAADGGPSLAIAGGGTAEMKAEAPEEASDEDDAEDEEDAEDEPDDDADESDEDEDSDEK
jgi:hypothetical protein